MVNCNEKICSKQKKPSPHGQRINAVCAGDCAEGCAGGAGGCALYAGGSECCAMCATVAWVHLGAVEGELSSVSLVYAGGCALCTRDAGGTRHVLLCMLESVEGDLSLLEVPEVMRCVLLCLLEVFKVPEAMHCMLFCLRWRCWRC